MSGYASFDNFHTTGTLIEIPCIDATPETLKGLGHIVKNFEDCPVMFKDMTDSVNGLPLIIPRKEAVGNFEVWQKDGYSYAENHAVGSGLYTVAKVDEKDLYKFYIREVNYHPETSQVVFPVEKSPFILVLGTQTDKLKAFVFDGSCGFSISPRVWHQPPILHYYGNLTFQNKQAESHICVLHDSVKSSNVWYTFSYA